MFCFMEQGHVLQFIRASLQIIFVEIFQSARFRNKIEKKTAVFIYINTEQSSLEIKII